MVVVGRRLAPHQDHALAARCPRACASSALNTTLPVAAPGDAFSPLAIGVAAEASRAA